MRWTITTAALFFSQLGVLADETTRQLPIGLNSVTSNATIPKPLSDFTASHDSTGNKIYIAGGCDAVLGNVYNESIGEFACGSISNKLYAFDPTTHSFETMADLPVARYRHAAVMIDGYLWLVGGRDVNDNMIGQVDVFHTTNNSWRTFSDLPEMYHLSDLTGFPVGSEAFFAGGYNFTYYATTTVFSIETTTSLLNSTITVRAQPPLRTPRGDVASTLNTDQTFAIVGGGYSHINNYCEALNIVEKYDISSGEWSAVASFINGGSDKAIVAIDHFLYALGGETNIANFCSTKVKPEPGEKTVAVDAVEVYDGVNWTALEDLPQNRFRFAAVAVGKMIYSFGGQLDYNSSCMCYHTTNEVVVYTENFESAGPKAIAFGSSMLMLLISSVVLMF